MARSWKWRGPRRRRRPAEAESAPDQTGPDGRHAADAVPEEPLPRLLRAEPTHSREAGPSVLIRIAQGRTAVVVTAEQAEDMARELRDAAEQARRLPPQA